MLNKGRLISNTVVPVSVNTMSANTTCFGLSCQRCISRFIQAGYVVSACMLTLPSRLQIYWCRVCPR